MTGESGYVNLDGTAKRVRDIPGKYGLTRMAVARMVGVVFGDHARDAGWGIPDVTLTTEK